MYVFLAFQCRNYKNYRVYNKNIYTKYGQKVLILIVVRIHLSFLSLQKIYFKKIQLIFLKI